MAVEFKYNKTSLQEMNRQLKVRETALPTLKNKEAALRLEVKKARQEAVAYEEAYRRQMKKLDSMMELWGEFEPGLIQLRTVHYGHRKIAGVKIPVLETVEFDIQPLNLYQKPSWFLEGIQRMEELTRLSLRRETSLRAMQLLEVARKKTTQKVNLYEKVQIPAYEEAIRKIKRFLEDEANLSKAAQKIMKKRISALSQPA